MARWRPVYSFLYELLRRFRIAYPGIEIKLRTGDPEHAIAHILDGKEDITIAARPTNLPRGVAFKTDRDFSFVVYRATGAAKLPNVPNRVPLAPQEWASIPMILSESGGVENPRRRVVSSAWHYAKNLCSGDG